MFRGGGEVGKQGWGPGTRVMVVVHLPVISEVAKFQLTVTGGEWGREEKPHALPYKLLNLSEVSCLCLLLACPGGLLEFTVARLCRENRGQCETNIQGP